MRALGLPARSGLRVAMTGRASDEFSDSYTSAPRSVPRIGSPLLTSA
jgi:hypothetical protein